MMNSISNLNLKFHHIIIIISLVVLFLNFIFGFLLYMPMLTSIIKWQKELKQGHEMRKFYLKLPIPLDFRVYFFNITNPLQVQEGQKPIVKEIGPYCYDAYKEKILKMENLQNDTLTYSPNDTYFFNQTRSALLTQDDNITILNPLVVGIINAVAEQRPQFLSAINKALPIIFKESYSIYITVKVRDILFDGVQINCTVKDFSATAVCSQFKGQSSMKEIEKNIFMFSLFGPRNGSIPQQITVLRGIKDGNTLGNVVAIDNQTDLKIWNDPYCNKFNGTDGWIFPSFLKGDIYIVAPDLCRTFEAKYIEDSHFNGVKIKKYHTYLGDTNEPDQKCYCTKPNKCLPKGVLDMTKCMQVPLLCTLPHFLYTDPILLDQVLGLQPQLDKHVIEVYFEPITGTPMYGQRRMQFNLALKPLHKISIMKTVPEVIHPIMWIEEGVQLEGYLLDKIITVSTLLTIMSTGRYLCPILCLQFIAYGCYYMYKDWKNSMVEPIDENKPKSSNKPDRFPVSNLEEVNNIKNEEINNNNISHVTIH